MKMKILFVICIALLMSCKPANVSIQEKPKPSNLFNNNVEAEFNYTVVVIDSCEYLMWRAANGYLQITHKGNCKNHNK